MRQLIVGALLTSIVLLILQCNKNESISNLMGRKEITSSLDSVLYTFGPILPDSLQDTLIVYIDSVIWAYDFPSGGSSSTSIIISGLICGKSTYPHKLDSIKAAIRLDSTIKATIQLESAMDSPLLDSTIKAIIIEDSKRQEALKTAKGFEITGTTQLEVEVYVNGTPATVPLVHDATGRFIDTVQIATTPQPEVILTESSKLFVRTGGQEFDFIPLDNPW